MSEQPDTDLSDFTPLFSETCEALWPAYKKQTQPWILQSKHRRPKPTVFSLRDRRVQDLSTLGSLP